MKTHLRQGRNLEWTNASLAIKIQKKLKGTLVGQQLSFLNIIG
jgi:hypothetical protein